MSDAHDMRRCVALAHAALAAGEVPVGAVVVDHDRIVSEDAEAIKARLDPSAHAERIATRAACRATRSLSRSRLTVYGTATRPQASRSDT